jgi:NAD(P)-dependent dehydrogenase (short-subunit alcohol dehydrogenase family)
MQGEKKVALVTGSSGGIGFETALLLSKAGFNTYASMRNLGKSRNITQIAITSKEPEIRYLVGDDAKSIMKVRKNTSDKEFENWMYEKILKEKGFVRAKTLKAGSI